MPLEGVGLGEGDIVSPLERGLLLLVEDDHEVVHPLLDAVGGGADGAPAGDGDAELGFLAGGLVGAAADVGVVDDEDGSRDKELMHVRAERDVEEGCRTSNEGVPALHHCDVDTDEVGFPTGGKRRGRG